MFKALNGHYIDDHRGNDYVGIRSLIVLI